MYISRLCHMPGSILIKESDGSIVSVVTIWYCHLLREHAVIASASRHSSIALIGIQESQMNRMKKKYRLDMFTVSYFTKNSISY